MDKVSVIMPCYNDGKYIGEAISSVWAQTYKNIELIIIDDGSDDEDTKRLLCSISQDKRVSVLYAEHAGPASARNFGIENATGTFILPLDSDDIIEPTYIEKAVDIIQKDKAVGAVYCQAYLFGEKRGRWELPDFSLRDMLIDNIVFVTALFRKTDWERVGGFDISMDEGMEDYDFWISILEIGKEIYQIPETLFYYRIKKESRTTKFLGDIDKTKNIYKKIYYKHKQFYEKYAEEYAIALREALIEQIYVRRKYERRFEKFQLFRNIPFIKRIVQIIFRER